MKFFSVRFLSLFKTAVFFIPHDSKMIFLSYFLCFKYQETKILRTVVSGGRLSHTIVFVVLCVVLASQVSWSPAIYFPDLF